MASKGENKTSPILSEQYPMKVLCDFIDTYSGERDVLPAFLSNCRNALDMASDSQKGLLLKFIISKLRGKAQIACSNRIFDDFDSLKDFLKQNFGERKHYNHLLLELQSCKQRPEETVAQYVLRIETCLTNLQTEIHNSETLKKELAGRIAMTEDLALYTFTIGLRPNISNVIRCRDPKTLNAAANIAMEEEKFINTQKNVEVQAKPKFCKNCNKKGHSESECYFNKKRDDNRSRGQSRTQSGPWPQYSRNSNNATPIICRYCKNIGHDISECRKRQFNNSLKAQAKAPYQQQHFIDTPETSSPPQGQETNYVDDLN